MIAVEEEDRATVRVGETIGVWRLVRVLGQGGMGEVFLAERADGQFAQTAALKLVRRGREHDPLLIRRFLEERRILATLAHPKVARLLDGGVTDAGLPWFAMEYVPGRPLDRYADEHQLDVPARLALMEQVLGAVAYAHQNLLVHRDLKPGNIFVTDDGDVKLLDFGIAKLLGDQTASDPEVTLAYGRIMTPEYASPEQVRGERVTAATDIYSLGAVMYQLLTGQRAHRFEKFTAAEIERVVCSTDPEAPSHAVRALRTPERPRPALASDLDTIVLKALQKDPARRYASAEAMLEDLRRFRTGRPLLARPDSFRYRAGKFVGRHRVAVAGALIVMLALIAGVASTMWQAREARLEAARADRVKRFLIDLLRQADPNVTQGKEFSVRQLLERGTQQVDSQLAHEPEVAAELYEVLGNTYAHLDLVAQADTLHRKGLAVARRIYGPGSQEVLDQVMAVAWGLTDLGEYAAADTLLTGALGDYRAAGGAESQALSDALDILATAKKRLDHPAAAESLYRESLAMQVRLTGATDTITASRLSDLGSLLAAQDRLAPAESALTAAQQHRRGVLPPLDVKFLAGESNLAMIEMKRGDLAAADPRLRSAVAGLVQVDSPAGLNAARALDRLALLESLELHVNTATVTAARALAMFRAVMGSGHPETLNSASLFAYYESIQGGSPATSADARAAYVALERKVGDRHDLTLYAGQRFAFIQLESGDARAAGALATILLATVHTKYDRIPPAFARLVMVTAAAQAARGDSGAADSAYRAALVTLAPGTRVDSAVYPDIVVRYAALLIARGSAAAAESQLKRALAFVPRDADPSARVVGELQAELGRSLAAQGKFKKAGMTAGARR
jgi:serine/threonine-protein kinase